MKYRVGIFDDYCVEADLENFLNNKRIKPEQIVSISFACDSDAPKRFRSTNVNKILLAYLED